MSLDLSQVARIEVFLRTGRKRIYEGQGLMSFLRDVQMKPEQPPQPTVATVHGKGYRQLGELNYEVSSAQSMRAAVEYAQKPPSERRGHNPQLLEL